MPLLARLAHRIAATARVASLAALLAFLPCAHAQSPELQDVLDEVVGHWKSTQGERLSENNCDYTAIDVAKQALTRAGFTNKAAGPVVIGALENACKGALDLLGLGLVTNTYSLAKCVYEYYTSANDARSLITCLGVEVAGIGAGKLIDYLDVDPATGALTGRVIDRIGDDLKAGGLDDLAANAKAGEIREFARRLKEALEQVQRAAREKQQNEGLSYEYTGVAYGCTVSITIQFTKGKPPTRGGNNVAMSISIRDCDCSASPPVGRALERASIYIRVPVRFTPGPGSKPAWTPDLGQMRTVINSKCCFGAETHYQSGPTGTGTTGDPPVTTPTPPSTPQPPQPPAPPPPPPTLAERCPECAPIITDIQNDRWDIENAQGRIERADEDLKKLRDERRDLDDEIRRAQQLIEIARRGVRGLLSGSGGGVTIQQQITADGKKVTTRTHSDGRVERTEEATGNRDIDSANQRIVAARAKLQQLAPREEAARTARERAVADKAAAEAKLRADEARLRQCEEECRKRISTPPPPPPIGVVPGAPTTPVQPPAPPAAPPPSQPPRQTGSSAPQSLPEVPEGACDACKPAYRAALLALSAAREWAGQLRDSQDFLDMFDEADAGLPPRAGWDPSEYSALTPLEKVRARQRVRERYGEKLAGLLEAVGKLNDAIAALEACNRTCATVSVDTVIGVTGTNPFNPDNPTGTTTPGGPTQPPPAGGQGTLQFSAPTYSGGEGGAVLIVVTRTGGSRGVVSVRYDTFVGTAGTADFQSASGRLEWADGDATPKSFSVALIDDSAVEGPESFSLDLSGPLGGATVGSPAQTTVSIIDNDSPPTQTGSLQFSSPSYATAEGQGNVTITVTRSGGSSGAVSVQYLAVSGTASAGSDFQAASGALSWVGGDATPKSFTIAIIDDSSVESSESFSINLSSPTGGASLGAPATATVTIADNDVASGPCGQQGNAWQPNTGAAYNCSGSCVPTPTPQTVTVSGMQVTISPFHAGGAASFTGCSSSLNSDRNDLTYFGQNNHRAGLARTGNNSYSANITSSGGGTCFFSCSRSGP